MTNKLLSVIIPVYNVEAYLERCLDSVCNQSYTNLEIICVDDGSTDGSAEILAKFAEKDTRIKVITKRNGGLSSARNVGLVEAGGELVSFVESSDVLEPQTYEMAVGAMQNNEEIGFVCWGIDSENANEFGLVKSVAFVLSGANKFKTNGMVSNKLFRMDLLKKYNLLFCKEAENDEEMFFYSYANLTQNGFFINEKLLHKNVQNERKLNLESLKDVMLVQEFLINGGIYKANAAFVSELFCNKFNALIKQSDSSFYPKILGYSKNLADKMGLDKKVKLIKNLRENNFPAIDPSKFFNFKFGGEQFGISKVKNNNEKSFTLHLKKKRYTLFKKFYTIWHENIQVGPFKFHSKNNKLQVEKMILLMEKMQKQLDATNAKLNLMYQNGLRIDEKKIVCYTGTNPLVYGCNPKYIVNELLRQNVDCKIVWIARNALKNKENFPPQIKLIEADSNEAINELLTAKIWIDNDRKIAQIKKGLFKNDGQFYIQTWHGSLGLKVINEDMYVRSGLQELAQTDLRYTDYLLSNSEFEDFVFTQNCAYECELVKTGHPRLDLFFGKTNELKEQIAQKLGFDANKKIALYAPTFRGDGFSWCYELDLNRFKANLERKFGGEWVILVRLHPKYLRESKSIVALDYGADIINAADYSDAMELLSVCDCLVSDYSSMMCDYLFTAKPAFIFALDYKQYASKDRGFFYSLETTPFSIATTNYELEKNILSFDLASYQQNVKEFVVKFNCIENGSSSKNAATLVKAILDGKNKEQIRQVMESSGVEVQDGKECSNKELLYGVELNRSI